MRRNRSEGGRAVGRPGGRLLAMAVLLTARPTDRLSAQAVTDAGQVQNSGALFLLFPVGAQAVGMGQTAVALDGRGEAAFWNPAGPATLPLRGVAVRNVGFQLQVNNRDQADPLPARVVVGAIYSVSFRPLPGGGDGDRFDVRFAADIDSPWGQVGSPQMRFGVDLGY